MKNIAITQLLLILTFAAPFATADTAPLATVSGTVQVNGTVLKTEGAKSAKDVIIYLERVGDVEYPAPSKEHALIDQKALVFVPHVLPVQVGTIVDFVNSDTTDHNVFCVDECCALVEDINAKKPQFLDLGNFPGGQRASHTFAIPGEAVVLCKLHPEMAAYIVVLETPYFTLAQVDADTQSAVFSIENVPAGDYIVKAWNKKCQAPEQTISVGEGGISEITVDLQRKQRKKRSRKG